MILHKPAEALRNCPLDLAADAIVDRGGAALSDLRVLSVGVDRRVLNQPLAGPMDVLFFTSMAHELPAYTTRGPLLTA